jgi:alanyl-tRNA synthetase
MKALAKPEFEKNYQKYYPINTFQKIGFTRNQCPKCHHYYWRHSTKADTCGDSNCVGMYNFIGKGTGIGKTGTKITYLEAWKGLEKSLCTARIPCTAIKRYPVMARWRDDVEFTAAGIYCFQPYCVTGEMDAPANPLVCPQFCVRFNDLDNIGITGRHYSGFIMAGIQVFNLPGKHIFFSEECTEFNYNWLTETLKIDPDEITFTEDVWCGGGNLGPSIEYFVGGLEIGNMVFMQFKTMPDGSLIDLPVKVIDVGIGLERIPWLINGTPTSYIDTFDDAYRFLQEKLNLNIQDELWKQFGTYSCQLNVDDSPDINKTWENIAGILKMETAKVREGIEAAKDLYIVLDHSRTLMMIIEDGGLPSNVGGGSNVRNVLRRLFAILHKHKWWEILKIEGLLELFEKHRVVLGRIYGEFPKFESFKEIIEIEYDRWLKTDDEQKKSLDKLLKKKKGAFTLNEWILAMTTYGISADKISEISKLPIPPNIYYEIAERESKIMKMADAILYSTSHIKDTENLYYVNHRMLEFDAEVAFVFENVMEKKRANIIALSKSAFYPTSGGQLHDNGTITINGIDYNLTNCERIGKVVLHFLDKDVKPEEVMGKVAKCKISRETRDQLRWHHTATHIIYCASKAVLGPHVWQHGAKKTVKEAHLDITHYRKLTDEEEHKIEYVANQIISENRPINKYMLDKPTAEKKFGFRLYQGGAIPGNSLRIVDIEGRDTEACCGTHCDYTGEIGTIKILKTQRISDGIVRLTFVAGKRALDEMMETNKIIADVCNLWQIDPTMIVATAKKFFLDFKKQDNRAKKLEGDILNYQIKYLAESQNVLVGSIKSDMEASFYLGRMGSIAGMLQPNSKGIIINAENSLIIFTSTAALIDINKFKLAIEANKPEGAKAVNIIIKDNMVIGGEKKVM